jgi:cbb3-type cytochrome oxidase subunit 1
LGGQQHLLQTPTPAWLKTIATLATVGLFLPSLAVVINLFMTMRGNWQKVHESVALKFIIAGTVLYLVTAVQGSLQAIQGFDRVVHYTQWGVGHTHLALFGGCSLWLMGALYHLVPVMLRRRIWSESLGEAQFWLATGGFVLMMLSLQIGGLIQGAAWEEGTSEVGILSQLKPYFIARGIGGAMMMASGLIMAFNFYKTATAGEAADMPTRVRGAMAEGYTGGR